MKRVVPLTLLLLTVGWAGVAARQVDTSAVASPQTTTTSPEALKAYTEAGRLYNVGEVARAISLMEQAVALDTAFAMAYRRLAAWYNNAGRTADMKEASRRAVRFSEGLPRRERDLIRAYDQTVRGDDAAAIRTYREVLSYTMDGTASNNMALLLFYSGQYHAAREVLEAAQEANANGRLGYLNLYRAQMALRDVEAARRTLDRAVQVSGLPPSTQFPRRAELAARTGAVEEAHAWADSMEANGSPIGADYYRWAADFRVGRVAEAAQHMAERADRQNGGGAVRPANWSRVTQAVSILQADTAHALQLLEDLVRIADRAGPDSVFYGNLAWAHWQAGSTDGVRKMTSMAASHQGQSADLDTHVRYIHLLDAVTGGRYDLAAYDAVEKDCGLCQRPERAEMAYGDGRLEEAVDVYEEMLRVPGWQIWADIWAPLHHERVAAIYEELGYKAKAAEHYQAFARMWAGADEDLQPRVRRALEKAATLGADPTS